MANGWPLYDFAYIPKAKLETKLQELSALAANENWEYRHTPTTRPFPGLFNYLHYTFMRVQEEGKVLESPDKACFNTGLVTENQEEIYAYFVPNTVPGAQRWFLDDFCRESDRKLLAFGNLPDMAHYFDEPGDLLYDTRLPLRKNLDHIIDDNRDRFPEPFRSLSDNFQLRLILEGAIEDTLARVRRNYKTAIPQYYRGPVGKGQLQLLLPLSLTRRGAADLALAVYRQGDVYLAATCLTLDMAYTNARLIARPDVEWLLP